MLYAIDIHDSHGQVLTVNLRKILDAMGDVPRTLRWSLRHLWAVGDLPGRKSVLDYEEEAKRSDSGIPITWEELESLANNTSQIIDAVFVGNRDTHNAMSVEDTGSSYSRDELTIEANDSTSWRVVSGDETLIRRVRRNFTDVSDVAASELASGD